MPQTILVVAEQREGKLSRTSLETVSAAQAIGRETGWAVEIVLPGHQIATPATELASKTTAAVVLTLEAPALGRYTADAFVYALKQLIVDRQPTLVLFPHTYQVRDFAPRLALALDRTLISDCTGYRYEPATTGTPEKLLFTRQMFQGKFTAEVSFGAGGPWLATIQAGAFRPEAVAQPTATIEMVAAATASTPARVVPHEVFQEAHEAVDLDEADIIVAIGRGIKEQRNVALAESLARALGAEIAASRPICDNGWLPLDRQIGSSGQTVAPRLYVALGISGAIQHLVGMKSSGTIVAINKDPEAPIFEIADLGVVGDLFNIVPALTDELAKAKTGA